MPYEIRKEKGGFKVAHKGENKTYSDKPMSRSKALKQMRAMYANTKREDGRLK